MRSETLSVDDGGASFLILCLGDPHGLEGRQRRKDGSSNPHQKLPLSWCDHLDLHGGGSEGSHLLAEPLGNAGVHGRSTGHDDVAVEILPDVHVALEDGLVTDFVETRHLLTDDHGLEESLRAPESLRADSDYLTVRQLVGLVVLGGVAVG